MVNLRSSSSDSAKDKKDTLALISIEKSPEKLTTNLTESRLRFGRSTLSRDGNSDTLPKVENHSTSSEQESIKTKKQNVTDAKTKKKVNKAKIKTLDEFISPISKETDKIINSIDDVVQQNSKENSPTGALCKNFSSLCVNGNSCNHNDTQINLKKKQANNNQKQNTTRRCLKLNRSKSESELTNHKVTDYFQVRKSVRQESKSIIEKTKRDLENKIVKKIKDGLEIKEIKDKGRGIVTTKKFHRGDFVIEYIGDLIDRATAKQRENMYAKNKNLGCYMYYFRHKDVQYCIDATEESGELGRLINHSRKGNLISKIVDVEDIPRLVFFAKVDIPIGTELLYDYGDRSRDAVKHHPWLAL